MLYYSRSQHFRNVRTSFTEPRIQPSLTQDIDLNPCHLLAPFRISAQRCARTLSASFLFKSRIDSSTYQSICAEDLPGLAGAGEYVWVVSTGVYFVVCGVLLYVEG
jgi:hypothetical protein